MGDQIHVETCRKILCRMHMCGSTGWFESICTQEIIKMYIFKTPHVYRSLKLQLVSNPVDPPMCIAPYVEIPEELCNWENPQVCGLLEHVDFQICRSDQFHKYELHTRLHKCGCIKTFSLLGQAWIKKRMTDNQHAVLENLHNNTMWHNSVVFYGEPMQYSLDPEDRCRTSCQAVYYLTHSSTSLSNPWLDRASTSGWRYQQKLSIPYLASAVTPVSPMQPDSLGQKVTVWT